MKVDIKRLVRAIGIVAVALLFAWLISLAPMWLGIAVVSLLWVAILYRTSKK
ncbi:hypothetical protein [Lactococcus lactis]|uniref:hypothetical protein n=1 Tax=Lactococcus lactis TaxID=1358 RepID=UPI000A6F3A3F|nr:hypothetical protein [Lactococcus lactis]